jgi:hypothetical protein
VAHAGQQPEVDIDVVVDARRAQQAAVAPLVDANPSLLVRNNWSVISASRIHEECAATKPRTASLPATRPCLGSSISGGGLRSCPGTP